MMGPEAALMQEVKELRAALAKRETSDFQKWSVLAFRALDDAVRVKQEATQPVRVPLTYEQILSAVTPLYGTTESAFANRIDDIQTARAIEKAHGIGGDK
jgi:hypothetical protein